MRMWLVVVGLALAVGAAALVVLAAADDGDDSDDGVVVEQLGDRPFDEDGYLPGRPSMAEWSPDGNHIAQVTADGAGLAVAGRFRSLTPTRARVAELAWMPGSNAVVVAEGPGFLSRLSVLDLSGKSLGNVALDPGFEVSSGQGMTVSSDGTQVVVSGLIRPEATGPARRALMAVELASGLTRVVTGGLDGTSPGFLAAGEVAFTVRSPGADPYTGAVSLLGGERRRLAPGALVRPLDDDRVATVTGRTVRAGGAALLVLEQGAAVLDVHPRGNMALVRLPLIAGSSLVPRVRGMRIPRTSELSMYREGPWQNMSSSRVG